MVEGVTAVIAVNAGSIAISQAGLPVHRCGIMHHTVTVVKQINMWPAVNSEDV